MQRLNITLDLENEAILTEKLEKVIKGAVISKTREEYRSIVNTEIERIIAGETEKWDKAATWHEYQSKLDKTIQEEVNSKIRSEIVGIQITERDINNVLDEKLQSIDTLILKVIERRLANISLEDHILKLIKDEVGRKLPAQILDLIICGVTAEKEKDE